MEFLVNAVEFVAMAGRVSKIYLGCPVTVDTPSHAEGSELLYFIHFLDGTVASLTLHFSGFGMLSMAEEDVVRQIMDLDPFYGFGILRIVFACFGIVAGVAV